MRLIDADALREEMEKYEPRYMLGEYASKEGINGFCLAQSAMIHKVLSAPIVDAIPTDILHTRCHPSAEQAFQRKMFGCLKIVPVNYKEGQQTVETTFADEEGGE